MKKLILILIVCLVLGCSDTAGKAFIGTWQNLALKNVKIKVNRHEGGAGFTITEEIYHEAVPAQAEFWPAQREKTDTRIYSGIQDGNSINVTVGMGFVTAMEIKDGQLIFDTGRSCANCNRYRKIN